MADCRKGYIDKVLVKSISRFARNTTECLETIRELKSLGISIYFEELIDKIIMESNVKIRFRLKNGLELPESIERTVR